MSDKIWEVQSHFVYVQCISNMSYSFIIKAVGTKIERSECLFERKIPHNCPDIERSIFTAFTPNALAKCCAPSVPMLLPPRSRVVSVCLVQRYSMSVAMYKNKALLCSLVMQLPNAVHLHYQCS